MSDYEIVYVVSNAAMPGILKIGRTSSTDTMSRIDQLYTTGVPVPFTLEYACKVPNAAAVETALHTAFGPNRVNPRREFFRISSEQVIAILKLLDVTDATPEVKSETSEVDEQSRDAAEVLVKRRPKFNFEEMGIPAGSELHSTHGDSTVTVIGPKKVKLNDEEMSFTSATQAVLQLDYAVQPGPHWTYKGKLLSEIYDETYQATE